MPRVTTGARATAEDRGGGQALRLGQPLRRSGLSTHPENRQAVLNMADNVVSGWRMGRTRKTRPHPGELGDHPVTVAALPSVGRSEE
jgi:hypothetical protein